MKIPGMSVIFSAFKQSRVNAFLVKFYIVGTAGIMISATRGFFLAIFPAAIIFSFILLIAYPEKKPFTRFYLAVIFLILSGFLIEVAGVNTGKIFGEYFYGRTLGPKILNTPPVIGVNWALLVLSASSVTEKLKTSACLKIFSASVLMVIYDFIMEISAPDLGMWHWENNSVPLRNYAAWFGIAILMNSILRISRIESSFKTAPAILLSQLAFFTLLAIYFNFAK